MAKTILVDTDLCTGCKSCETACAIHRASNSKELRKAINENPTPLARIHVHQVGLDSIPMQCRQCNDYPCLKARKNREDSFKPGSLCRLLDVYNGLPIWGHQCIS